MPATTDRGDVVHLAGRLHLSPALRDGAPVLVGHGAGGDPAARRCGWEPFFRAMGERGLAVGWDGDGEDAATVRLVARAEARANPPHRPSLARSVADARRLLLNLRR